MSWYKARMSGNGQGLVVEADTGRIVAVTYDEKNAALVAAVMGLMDYRCRRSGKYRAAAYRYAEDVLRAAEGDLNGKKDEWDGGVMAGLVKYADWIIGGTVLAGWLVIVVAMLLS
ncbi:MAG: hypothetical protein RBU21_04510 [FCB group bacterium]|jgi:hypothetical protein|nr:hypothetical protein [FCB group bacterium]